MLAGTPPVKRQILDPRLQSRAAADSGGRAVKKFRFRFEAVQRQRSAVLDAATAEMAEVMTRRELAASLLAERRHALDTLTAEGPRPGRPFDPRHEMVRQRHLGALREEIRRREVQVKRLDEVLAEARAKVAEAHRALRAIEILEERDRDAWRAEARKEEQREIDERNAQQHES